MKSYIVKENNIGSAVRKILRYRQTDRQADILLLYYKDKGMNNVMYWFFQALLLSGEKKFMFFSTIVSILKLY